MNRLAVKKGRRRKSVRKRPAWKKTKATVLGVKKCIRFQSERKRFAEKKRRLFQSARNSSALKYKRRRFELARKKLAVKQKEDPKGQGIDSL